MRKLVTLIILHFFFLAQAQTTFEGVIEMKMSSADKPDMGITKMYFSALGGRIETEIKISPNLKSFKTVRIYTTKKQDLYYIINDASATYSISDFSKSKNNSDIDKEVNVKVIGVEKILGYTCTHAIISTKSGQTEIWTSKDLIEYDSYKRLNESDLRSRNASYAKALIEAQAEGFPVKTIKKDSKGNAITIELAKAERKKLDKILFEVPDNYTKTETPTTGMEGMMQEIKQMGDQTVKEE